MFAWLFEVVTGRPWMTVRSAAEEFGPPPAAVYEAELNGYPDLELIANGDEILAAVKAGRRSAVR